MIYIEKKRRKGKEIYSTMNLPLKKARKIEQEVEIF